MKVTAEQEQLVIDLNRQITELQVCAFYCGVSDCICIYIRNKAIGDNSLWKIQDLRFMSYLCDIMM